MKNNITILFVGIVLAGTMNATDGLLLEALDLAALLPQGYTAQGKRHKQWQTVFEAQGEKHKQWETNNLPHLAKQDFLNNAFAEQAHIINEIAHMIQAENNVLKYESFEKMKQAEELIRAIDPSTMITIQATDPFSDSMNVSAQDILDDIKQKTLQDLKIRAKNEYVHADYEYRQEQKNAKQVQTHPVIVSKIVSNKPIKQD